MNNSAMYNIGYGLYVLTALADGKDNGCIINTVTQVTVEPNRMTISVSKENLTHDMVMSTGTFNVSILTEEAPFEIFKHFGFQTGRNVNKFEGRDDLPRSKNGLIYLPEYSNAFISGSVINARDLGTHTLFVADVTDGDILSDVSSATYAYYHAKIKPRDAVTDKTGWRCRICGYIHEDDVLPEDFICPICKHGAMDFERINVR